MAQESKERDTGALDCLLDFYLSDTAWLVGQKGQTNSVAVYSYTPMFHGSNLTQCVHVAMSPVRTYIIAHYVAVCDTAICPFVVSPTMTQCEALHCVFAEGDALPRESVLTGLQ